jgi:predicted transcriptional regulator YdeE
MHEKNEKSLEDYAMQFRENEDDYDDFDYFVARETGVHLPEKPMSFGKSTTIETKGTTTPI